MSKADCQLLASRKAWTRVRHCSPPPKCQVEMFPAWNNPLRKPGIWCNSDGGVTVLSIAFKRLKLSQRAGTIPDGWGFLRSLRVMVLTGNSRLTGTVPAFFGRLANLTDLDLSHNHALSGAIPPALAKSPRLSSLRVAYSGIRGSIDQFSRTSPNPALDAPLYLYVRPDYPEVCFDNNAPLPNLVAAYAWDAISASRRDLVLPTCGAVPAPKKGPTPKKAPPRKPLPQTPPKPALTTPRRSSPAKPAAVSPGRSPPLNFRPTSPKGVAPGKPTSTRKSPRKGSPAKPTPTSPPFKAFPHKPTPTSHKKASRARTASAPKANHSPRHVTPRSPPKKYIRQPTRKSPTLVHRSRSPRRTTPAPPSKRPASPSKHRLLPPKSPVAAPRTPSPPRTG